MSNDDVGDEELELSVATTAALSAFLKEQTEEKARFEQLQQQAHTDFKDLSMHAQFKENWQLSQFWYDDKTSQALAIESIRCTSTLGSICFISAPSAFLAIKKINPDRNIMLFEFDERFNLFKSEFTLYDYNAPEAYSSELQGSFDYIIADPPFLSQECFEKTAITIKSLMKSPSAKVVICTGEIQSKHVLANIENAWKTPFVPKHEVLVL